MYFLCCLVLPFSGVAEVLVIAGYRNDSNLLHAFGTVVEF